MKIKKIFAGFAASAVAVSLISAASVSAVKSGDTVIDFEDGDFSFIEMGTFSGGDSSKTSVVDFGGSKQLKVEPTAPTKHCNLMVRLANIVAPEDLVKIAKIEATLTFASKDGESPVGWHSGQVAIDTTNSKPAWGNTNGFECAADDTTLATYSIDVSKALPLPTSKFKEGAEAPTFHCQTWGGDDSPEYAWYMDNIKLFDDDGNPIALTVGGAATEETVAEEVAAPEAEAAPAEVTTAAPAETEAAAPAVDTTEAPAAETEAPEVTEAPAATEAEAPAAEATPAPATGNPVTAGAIAGVMLAAAGAAVISRKRK